MGSQSSVPWDPNGVFWLAQKWLTLFVFVALIKMLCCWLMQWTGIWHTKFRSNWLWLALSISIKTYLWSLLHHHHSQEYFFNWNITTSPDMYDKIIALIFSLWLQCSLLLIVICGGFDSRRFSYSKIFYLFLVLIAK